MFRDFRVSACKCVSNSSVSIISCQHLQFHFENVKCLRGSQGQRPQMNFEILSWSSILGSASADSFQAFVFVQGV